MSEVLFFIAAIVAITAAFGVVMLRDPFYAVLALVCHLVSLAALFLLLRAEFVAAAQVVVYAGAVMVLYLFVVAYVGAGEQMSMGGNVLRLLGPLLGVALAVELCIAMLGSALRGIDSTGAPYKTGFGTPAHIGQLFLTDYLFVFEVASLLLLVAAVGAVVLARRRRGLEDDEEPAFERLVQQRRPAYTGTNAESVGVRKVLKQLEDIRGGIIELDFRRQPAAEQPAAQQPSQDAPKEQPLTVGPDRDRKDR